MTKMAAMPIYGKNPLKIFFPGTSGTITNLVCSIRDYCPSKVLKLFPWVDLDLFFGKVNVCNLCFDIENVTVMDSLESIAAFDLEIG